MTEAELFELLEHTADAAYAVTGSGDVCSWNHAAAELFGYAPAEALGERVLRAARELSALAGDSAALPPVEALTPQELRILRGFANGGTQAAIARALHISPQTLRNHLHHINRKLRTHSRLEAVVHARRHGLID